MISHSYLAPLYRPSMGVIKQRKCIKSSSSGHSNLTPGITSKSAISMRISVVNLSVRALSLPGREGKWEERGYLSERESVLERFSFLMVHWESRCYSVLAYSTQQQGLLEQQALAVSRGFSIVSCGGEGEVQNNERSLGIGVQKILQPAKASTIDGQIGPREQGQDFEELKEGPAVYPHCSITSSERAGRSDGEDFRN